MASGLNSGLNFLTIQDLILLKLPPDVGAGVDGVFGFSSFVSPIRDGAVVGGDFGRLRTCGVDMAVADG